MSCPILPDTSDEVCTSVTLTTDECYPDPPTEAVVPPDGIVCVHFDDPGLVFDGSWLICSGS